MCATLASDEVGLCPAGVLSATMNCERCQCAGEAVATDRLFVAAGLQPVPIREEQWLALGSPTECQAHLRSRLPAGVLVAAA